MTALFYVRPARTYSNGCKSPPMCPDNGKHTANGKGVHRELESANIWSDAQKLDMKA